MTVPLSEQQALVFPQEIPPDAKRFMGDVARKIAERRARRLKAEQEQQKDGDRSE